MSESKEHREKNELEKSVPGRAGSLTGSRHPAQVGGLAYHEGKRYASHPLQAPETPRNDPQHQTTPPSARPQRRGNAARPFPAAGSYRNRRHHHLRPAHHGRLGNPAAGSLAHVDANGPLSGTPPRRCGKRADHPSSLFPTFLDPCASSTRPPTSTSSATSGPHAIAHRSKAPKSRRARADPHQPGPDPATLDTPNRRPGRVIPARGNVIRAFLGETGCKGR